MDIFFMSVWDDARLGTKYYICYGEDTRSGYHTDTLPILWLPDIVATQNEGARIIAELWFAENTYHLSFEPENGKHFFAPTRRVFELLAELKRQVADYQRRSPNMQNVGGAIRENAWVVGYGAGGGQFAGVDVGNGQMAFDIETLAVPYAGGGGAGGPVRSGSELHQYIAGSGRLPTPAPGEWGSLSRHPRERTARVIAERNVEIPQRSELPVSLRFTSGRTENCTVEHYNTMIDTGVWTGMGRIE